MLPCYRVRLVEEDILVEELEVDIEGEQVAVVLVEMEVVEEMRVKLLKNRCSD